MQLDFISGLFVFMLATFIGLDVIRRVSRLLHTPLMSLTNAISAIAIVGAIIVTGEQHTTLSTVLGAVAVFASTTNIVSGFLITDRMLKMFKKTRAGQVTIEQLTQLIYLISAGAFILSLKWMSDPNTARRGVFAGVGAMVLAVVGTLLYPHIVALSLDLHRDRRRHAGRRAAVVGAADRGAPADRALACVRRPGRRPGRHGQVLHVAPEGQLTTFRMAAIGTEVLLGYLTCTGSLMAAGKLQEMLPTRPLTYRDQNVDQPRPAGGRDRDLRSSWFPARRRRGCSRSSSCCRCCSACCWCCRSAAPTCRP